MFDWKAWFTGRRDDVPWHHLVVRAAAEDGRLFFAASDADEYWLGSCFLSAPLVGADSSTVERLISAIGIPLPAGSFIQFGLLSSPDIEAFLDLYVAGKGGTGNAFLDGWGSRRATFFLDGAEHPPIDRSGVLTHRQRLVITIKVPCSPMCSEQEQYEAEKHVSRLTETLKTAGIEGESQGAAGYLALMRLLHHLHAPPDAHYDSKTPIREQVFSPGDSCMFNKQEIVFNEGEAYAKVMSVKHYPERANLAIMNQLIGDPHGLSNQITDPYYLCFTLHYPDQIAKKADVQRRYAWINHQIIGPTAHMIPTLGYKKAGFDALMHEIAASGAPLCEANLTLVLFSRDLDRLTRLVAGLRAHFSTLQMHMIEDQRILKDLWHATLPLNTSREGIRNLYRFQTMSVTHAAQFLPILGEWQGTGASGTSMFLTRRGHPALFDLFDSNTNFNATIFAEAGAGKSFTAQLLMTDLLSEGAKVWAIDIGRSYYKLCRAITGQFIAFSENETISLNPFTHVEQNMLGEEMEFLKTVLAKMAAPEAGLDDFGMSRMEEAINAVFSTHGPNAEVTEVAEWFLNQSDPRDQDIGKQLFPYTRRGSHGHWFAGQNNLDFDRPFVVLELEDLKSKPMLQQVVLLQIMNRITSEMLATSSRKKILVVDEAWQLLDDPLMARAMEALYRKVRKAKGAVVIITQSIADLYNSPNGRAIAANSAWQLILTQKSESIDAAVKGDQFKIDPYGAYTLKSLHVLPGKYSEMMIKRGETDWGVVRLVADRFTNVLFSTRGAERDEILTALDQGADAVATVEDFIARND